jgi:DinB superfamily
MNRIVWVNRLTRTVSDRKRGRAGDAAWTVAVTLTRANYPAFGRMGPSFLRTRPVDSYVAERRSLSPGMDTSPRLLEPREVGQSLRSLGAAVEGELRNMPEDVLAWHPAPGEWCIKECVGHLIEAERRGFAGRIRTLLAETEPTMDVWDQQAIARARNDCTRSAAELVNEFTALRTASVALVDGLGVAELQRGGIHPAVGHLRIQDLLHEWLHHDRNHFRQMLANTQAYVWPGMANAQRFSAD